MKKQSELNRLKDELDRELSKPYQGVDTDQLVGYVDHKKIKWKIREDGHTKKIKEQVIKISDDFKKRQGEIEKNPHSTRMELERSYEKATKGILELVLVDFVYEKWANHVKAGPNILGLLANELSHFLVELGGRAGAQHSRTLQKLDTFNHLITSKAARASGRRTAGQGQESVPSSNSTGSSSESIRPPTI